MIISSPIPGDAAQNSYSRGLDPRPQVLLLDEPTLGLDPSSARLLKDILRALVDRGAAVFMSTHILEIAEHMCPGWDHQPGKTDCLRHHGPTPQSGPETSLEDIFLKLTGGAEYRDTIRFLGKGEPMNLLKWKLHLLWRSLTATEAKRVGTVMVALLLLVWIFVAFAGIRSFFAFLVGWEENLEAPLAEGVLAVLYLVGLAVSLFTACGSAFVVMYSSSDLELLFAAPLPVGQVFTVKFFEILASVVTPMFFLTIPLMLGYGAAVGAGWQYYPAVLLLALFSLLWPTALGSALNLLVMRIVPPYQVREVGVALGSLLGGLIYAAIQFGSRSVKLFDAGQIAQMQGRISLAQVDLLPTWWLAQATLAAGRGDWPGFFSWAALVAGSALVFFGLSFFLVQEAFYGGWAGSGEVRRRKKVGSRGWGLGRRLGSLLPSSVVLAVAGKEIKMITRDLGNGPRPFICSWLWVLPSSLPWWAGAAPLGPR